MSRKKNQGARLMFEEVLDVMNSQPGKTWNYKQLAAKLGITDSEQRRLLGTLLDDLVHKGLVEQPLTGKYRTKSSATIIEGVVDSTQSGAAYVSSPDAHADIFVSAGKLGGALHGDTVRVKIFTRKRTDNRPDGEIIEVLRRARTDFACTLRIEKRVALGISDSKKIPDFVIPLDKIGKAKDGQKVVVRLTGWEDFSDLPGGEVIAVLGNAGENDTEINAIMVEFGLPYVFPAHVERAAGIVKTEITAEEISMRRDMRNVTTFTIDPFDAKDFDDALSMQKLKNGNWEIGVHIADVSHYVKPDSALDKEAVERATSVYLVDRVVPMLPEVLSNFVCSLRPNEDKLTFSAVFEMDANATLVSEWFGRTVINSNRRFSYEEVQEILEGKEGDFRNEILLLDKLAKKMRDDRMRNGSITFEKEEVKFHLDEAGNPTGVYFKVMKDSNQLIEDFMLLANRRVAEYCTTGKKAGEVAIKRTAELKRPFVYRVHPTPDPVKLKDFNTFIRTFGYSINTGSEKSIAQSLNKLLRDVQGKPEANMIETLAIRTMAKAIYTTENIGHYGLGFAYYTHFTSPIRRYPDVLAHRLLQNYLDVDNSVKPNVAVNQNDLESRCKHSSDREKRAAEAERASIKYKQVQFLQSRLGQEFDGIVSGVTEWGFFVELEENKCEGMVHVRALNDDRYVFDPENYCLRGMRSGKKFTIGDKLRVIVKSADPVKKQIDFEVAGDKTTKRTGPFSETSGRDDWNPGRTERKKKRGTWDEQRGARGNKRGGNGKKRR